MSTDQSSHNSEAHDPEAHDPEAREWVVTWRSRAHPGKRIYGGVCRPKAEAEKRCLEYDEGCPHESPHLAVHVSQLSRFADASRDYAAADPDISRAEPAPAPDAATAASLESQRARCLAAIDRLSWKHGTVRYSIQGINGECVAVSWRDPDLGEVTVIESALVPNSHQLLADRLEEHLDPADRSSSHG